VSSEEDSASDGNYSYSEGDDIEDAVSDAEMDMGEQRDVSGVTESSPMGKLRASPTTDVESIGGPAGITTSGPVSLDTTSHVPDTQLDASPAPLTQNVVVPSSSPALAPAPHSPSPEPTTEKRWIRTQGAKRESYREPCPKCEVIIPELERQETDRIVACSGAGCSILLVSQVFPM
jgi:hypothetical protein